MNNFSLRFEWSEIEALSFMPIEVRNSLLKRTIAEAVFDIQNELGKTVKIIGFNTQWDIDNSATVIFNIELQ